MQVVRVLPDVAGLDKLFDYSVPEDLVGSVRVGTRVRVELHGRRVGGWVVAGDVIPPPGIALRPIAKVTGWGPPPDVVALTEWGAWRWAGRRSALLTAASADRAVPTVPSVRPWPGVVGSGTFVPGRTLLRLAPGADRMPLIRGVVEAGPALIVVPSVQEAADLGRRLSRAGVAVAVLPDGWARARAGDCVVIGARSAAWAPAVGARTMVILDAHDEGHQDERAPTWHARDVLGERAARAGVPCVAVSPCPDLATLAWCDRSEDVDRTRERLGWPVADVVDLRDEDPANGLLTERLVAVLRGGDRVLCVLNRKDRARLLACAGCGELARCQTCDAAVAQVDAALVCPRCASSRPVVCAACGRQRLKVLRPGVSRLREHLAALLAEPVGEVTASGGSDVDARVVIGTEAVLHRAGRAQTVAFLDVDQELLAPRFRAAEEAMALVARAGRLTGGRDRGGRVLLQTRVPEHEVIQAVVHGDPGRVAQVEAARRAALRLPPATAVARLSGDGAQGLAEALRATLDVEVLGPADGTWMVRADDHRSLCDALARAPRPAGRLRIEVDPLRM